MPTTSRRHYDVQIYAPQWINPPPETPALIQIRVTNEEKQLLRTPQGNVHINYSTYTAPDFIYFFTIPLPALTSFAACNLHVFDQLINLGFDPTLRNSLQQHIVNSVFNVIMQYGYTIGFQVTLDLKVTTTIEMISTRMIYNHMMTPMIYDHMMPPLAPMEVFLMEDGDGDEPVQRRRGASKAAVDGLKKVVFFKGGDFSSGKENEKCTTCAVCLEEFGEGTQVTCMPCSHLFHHHCIVPWLETNKSCPMCRFEVPDQ